MSLKWTLCYCAFIVLALPVVSRKFRCDYSYHRETGGWLKLHRVPDTWQRARLRCHLEEGGSLASPIPELKSRMTAIMKSNSVSNGIFTGIHATISQGDYYTIEGLPLSKIVHFWAPGEPDNNKNQEHCIMLLPNGAIADKNCDETFPYICYKRNFELEVTKCGTVDPGYQLETRTGSCYKFHHEPRSWSDANMACSAESGYLAIINSDAEAKVIRELFSRNRATSMPGSFWKDVAFIGFHNWNDKGEWITLHGQTLSEAGYDKFSGGAEQRDDRRVLRRCVPFSAAGRPLVRKQVCLYLRKGHRQSTL